MLSISLTVTAFIVARFTGDPVTGMLAPDATAADYDRLRDALHLGEPIFVQYLRFAGGFLIGDFGTSWRQDAPVAAMIAARVTASAELVALAFLISLPAGAAIGLSAAANPSGRIARGLMHLSLVAMSIPTFLTAVALIWVFAVQLRWLPAFGRGETVELGFWSTGVLTESGRRALVLPTLTIAMYQTAWTSRIVCAEIGSVLQAPFIRAASARGLSASRILLVHALPVAAAPIIALLAIQLGHALIFAVVTERVFQWPGLGGMLIDAIAAIDRPVIAAYIVLAGLVFGALRGVAELLSSWIDPRLADTTTSRVSPIFSGRP